MKQAIAALVKSLFGAASGVSWVAQQEQRAATPQHVLLLRELVDRHKAGVLNGINFYPNASTEWLDEAIAALPGHYDSEHLSAVSDRLCSLFRYRSGEPQTMEHALSTFMRVRGLTPDRHYATDLATYAACVVPPGSYLERRIADERDQTLGSFHASMWLGQR